MEAKNGEARRSYIKRPRRDICGEFCAREEREKKGKRRGERRSGRNARSENFSTNSRNVIGYCDLTEYATDAEDSSVGMPQGNARNRNRGRRNRHRRNRPSLQRPANVAESPRNVEQRKPEEQPAASSRNERDEDDDDDSNTNDSVSRTAIPENADFIEGESLSRRYRIRPDDRRKVEKIELKESRPGIIEITTVSSLPLEATIGHIAGVGILETGSGDWTTVTISEPMESIRPFSGKLLQANGNRLEIREVDDSDTEVDCRPTIVEFESAADKEPVEGPRSSEELEESKSNDRVNQQFVPQKKFSRSETESPTSMCATVMPKDVERKLRNFIEGLQLPSFSEEAVEDEGRFLEKNMSRDVSTEEIKSTEKVAVSSRRKTRKRAMSTASHYARSFLDIIQEEGERLSEDEAQHIRDFINEEISKYRREDRHSAERTTDIETKQDDPEKIEEVSDKLKCDIKIKIDTTEDDVSKLHSCNEANNHVEIEQTFEPTSAKNVAEMQVTEDIISAIKVTNEEAKDDTSHESVEIVANTTQSDSKIESHIEIMENDAVNNSEERLPNNKEEIVAEENATMKSNMTASDTNKAEDNKLLTEVKTLAESPEKCDVSLKETETRTMTDNISRMEDEADSFSSPLKRSPPLPPRRSSSFGHEPQRPPTLPEIDYISCSANIHRQPLVATNGESTNLLARKRDTTSCEAEVADASPRRPELPKTCGSPSVSKRIRENSPPGSSRESASTIVNENCINQDIVSKRYAEDGRSFASSGIRDDDLSCSRGVALADATSTEITRRGEGKPAATLVAAATHDRSVPSSRQEGEAEVHRCPPSHDSGKKSSTINRSSKNDKSDVGPDSSAKRESTMGSSSTKSKGKSEQGEKNGKSTSRFLHRERTMKSEKKIETRIIERHEESSSANRRDSLCDSKYSTWESKREERHEEKHEEETSSSSRQSNARNSSDDETSFQRLDILTSKNPSPEDDVQGHDSSSSTTSLSTVKHRPLEASLTDISANGRETKENNSKNERKEESLLKRKLTLLKSAEDFANETSAENSPQPIPYSPIDLYYVSLNDTEEVSRNNREKVSKDTSRRPSSLRELCVKRILSMPFGSQMIDEITAPKLSIFESLRTLQRFVSDVPRTSARQQHNDNAQRLNTMHGMSDARRRGLTKIPDGNEPLLRPNDIVNVVSDRTRSPANVNIELSESEGEMEERWRALSTSEDPRLLVCLSPSQQASQVRASADTLLDLHRKFLNRYSYREEQPRCVSVPRYRVEIHPTIKDEENKDVASKTSLRMTNRDAAERSSSRLLEIIKEEQNGGTNAIIENDAPDSLEHSGGQRNLKAVRPNDWSNLDCDNCRSATANELFLAAGDKPNGHVTDRLRITPQFTVAPDTDGHRSLANGVAKVRDSERSFTKNASTLNSAIINRSMDVVGKRTPPLRRTADPSKHVNPALIDDRLEVPPLPKRAITVDRSCIDTTSIFDQNPPRSHLEPRRSCQETEKLKQVAAVEIMDKLKILQKETSRRLDGDRRRSLPQEYFIQQLKYIELLEEQLKNVIVAEEEERKAFEEFQTYIRTKQCDDARKSSVEETERKTGGNFERKIVDVPDGMTNEKSAEVEQRKHPHGHEEKRFENNTCRSEPEIQREHWREKSRNVEKTRTETIDKAGSRQFSRKVSHENGIHEESSETIERKECHVITQTGNVKRISENGTSELREGRINEEIRATEKSRNDSGVSNEKETRSHKKTIDVAKRPTTLPTNGEAFRQRMYDEYVDKVLERQERKNHKILKISSCEDISPKTDGDMSAMAKEFIEKARNRLNKFGIDLDESGTDREEDEDDAINAKFLIDGKELRDASGKLPKHLREFLKISVMSDDDEGGE